MGGGAGVGDGEFLVCCPLFACERCSLEQIDSRCHKNHQTPGGGGGGKGKGEGEGATWRAVGGGKGKGGLLVRCPLFAYEEGYLASCAMGAGPGEGEFLARRPLFARERHPPYRIVTANRGEEVRRKGEKERERATW